MITKVIMLIQAERKVGPGNVLDKSTGVQYVTQESRVQLTDAFLITLGQPVSSGDLSDRQALDGGLLLIGSGHCDAVVV